MSAFSRPGGVLRRLAGATAERHPPRRIVRLRLTALYGCLFLLSGAGLLVITNLLVQHHSRVTAFYITRASDGAQQQIKGVIGSFSAPVGLPSLAVVRQARGTESFKPGSGAKGATGVLVPPPIASAAPLAIPGGPRASPQVVSTATAQQLHAQARQLTSLAGKQRSAELDQLLIYSAIALGIMAVISVALGWLISGRALRPLDEAFEAQRRFVANASHELRTPLAMMRTSLDVAVAKPGPSSPLLGALEHKLREGLDQADGLLESFLTLARAQRGIPPQQNPVAIAPLLRAAVADQAQVAAGRDVEVDLAISEDASVSGSETLLRRMIENLIDNAIRHNEPGGWVHVAAGSPAQDARGVAHASAEHTRIVVENSGERLAEDDVAGLTEPFRRPGTERTGSQDGHGLGLSIVAAIADAHGAALRLQARDQGGLRVCIDLPRSCAPRSSGMSGDDPQTMAHSGSSEGGGTPAARLDAGVSS